MLEKDTLIKVTNRSKSRTVYYIPDLGIRRTFNGNETKEIEWDELKQLSWTDGGLALIQRNLVLQNAEAVKSILNTVEPEYYYSEADVKNLLLNGSVDELLDCLDFAPAGVIEIVKNMAVELPLNDMEKREAILDKTGFNVTTSIKIKNTKYDGDAEETEATEGKKRRVTKNSTDKVDISKRRTTTPTYKVVD